MSARDRSRTPVPLASDTQNGEWVTGTLKRIHGGNGFCSVEGVEKDVLLGSRSLSDSGVDLMAMKVGDYLTFQMVMGSKGYHATTIQQPSQQLQASQRVIGTLKRVHGGNAFFSVEGYETDVLLGSRSLTEAGLNIAMMQVGHRLTFEVESGPKGYHAVNIQQTANRLGPKGYSKAYYAPMAPYVQQPSQHWQASQLVVGSVKRIHGGNAFCSVDGFEKDVLLGSRSLTEAGLDFATMQVGDSLMFEVERGMKGYHAINIQQTVKGLGPKGHSKGYFAPMVPYVQQPSQQWQGSQRAVGTLKRIHGGNAFCSVDGFEKDVLLGSRSLTEAGLDLATMQVGDSLTFEVEAGPKGYHAINILKDDVGKRVKGTLKRIHGGNGFCSVEGVEKDVLLGSRSLSDSGVSLDTMQVGDVLSFELARGPKGYNATDIQKELASA